ncbi:MAG: hypothetical protein Q4G45_08935 [Actinomycetia bacterium]|nr:hypothetical protein [Actinomycetes bacterium]
MSISVTTVSMAVAGIFTSGAGDVWYANGTGPSGTGAAEAPPAAGRPAPPGYTGGGSGYSGGGGYSSGGSAGPLATQPGLGNTPVGGPISRAEVLARGRYWTGQGVPYSMSGYTNDPQGKIYRTDCSGLVSMALHLDDSLSTVSLPTQCVPISKEELKPGDLVGNLGPHTSGAGGHVTIFNGWVDASHTQFRTIEETPPRAVERTRTWGSAEWSSGAHRYVHLLDP